MYSNAFKNPILYIHIMLFVVSKEHTYFSLKTFIATYGFVQNWVKQYPSHMYNLQVKFQ